MALSQVIWLFKLETQSFTHLLPVMPFYVASRDDPILPILSISHFCPVLRYSFRILQINSLHLKYQDLNDWDIQKRFWVPENLQSHRSCYPCTGDPAPPGLRHPYLQNSSNTTVSGSLQLRPHIIPQTFCLPP